MEELFDFVNEYRSTLCNNLLHTMTVVSSRKKDLEAYIAPLLCKNQSSHYLVGYGMIKDIGIAFITYDIQTNKQDFSEDLIDMEDITDVGVFLIGEYSEGWTFYGEPYRSMLIHFKDVYSCVPLCKITSPTENEYRLVE